jgi:hypothetical protein
VPTQDRVIDVRLRGSGFVRRGAWSPWWSVACVALHFALRIVFDPWLNASSDAKFWVALTILTAPLALAVFALYRAIRPKTLP